MTLNDILFQLCDIDRRVRILISDAGFTPDDGLSDSLCPHPDDPEDRFLKKILEDLLLPFEDLHEELSYLRAPTHGEYRLELLPNGRYGYFDEHGFCRAFTCGSPIEARIPDDQGRLLWVSTRMEHDGKNYFLWHYSSVPLDGLTVRERW